MPCRFCLFFPNPVQSLTIPAASVRFPPEFCTCVNLTHRPEALCSASAAAAGGVSERRGLQPPFVQRDIDVAKGSTAAIWLTLVFRAVFFYHVLVH